MKKFLLSTLKYNGGILGTKQAEEQVLTGRGSCISMGEILRWKSRERR